MIPRVLFPIVALLAPVGCRSTAESNDPPPANVKVGEPTRSESARPTTREPTAERIASLRCPPGVGVEVYASGLEEPRMMVFHGGTLYLTSPDRGTVTALRDRDGDGRAEERRTVVADLDGVHGIAIHDRKIYLAPPEKVLVAELREDGTIGALRTLIDRLPAGRGHKDRSLAVGPDGKLYVSVGSTCNDCLEEDPEHAAILRFSLDGGGREVFARGLRNTIGFDWHPTTGELWGMDHGSDHRGNDLPPEELNRLQAGKDYGWPFAFGDRVLDPMTEDPRGETKAARVLRSEPAVLTIQAHSAPIAFAFHRGGAALPEDVAGDAFLALHGSWNRSPAIGGSIQRLRFEAGRPVRFEPFVDGFLIEDGAARFGRPAGVAIADDGALLFSDDENGMIYRVAKRKSEP